jgi:catechol 2,3-dioxygenase-like lactoylglutathione lyase family enzyme
MVQIERIDLVVGDLAAAQRFYVEALGFAAIGTSRAPGVQRAMLQLGQTRIDLLAFDAPGAAYSTPCAANDPWFQHFAIAVSDMAAAYS